MYRNATRRDEIRRLYLNALSQCLKSIICLKIPIKPKVQNLLTFPLFLLSPSFCPSIFLPFVLPTPQQVRCKTLRIIKEVESVADFRVKLRRSIAHSALELRDLASQDDPFRLPKAERLVMQLARSVDRTREAR